MANLSGGGAERMMVNLANGLAAQGVGVDLLLARASGPYLDDVSREVRVREVSPTGGVSRALPFLVRYLRKERPQLLVSTLHHASLVALTAKRVSLTRIPVFLREANTPSKRVRSLRKPKDLLTDELARLAYRYANGIIAVSDGVAEDLRAHFGLSRQKLTVLRNPVVTDDLLEQARADPGHLWLEAGQPPVVLGAGRLHVQKDFATLIRAFAAVRKNRAAKLIILGEGDERPALEELVRRLGLEDDVELPGFVDNPFAFMSRAALFVLSSKWEGLPGALIQAIACGCPVVATDCRSGPAEVLDGGSYGELVPVGDERAMAAAMLRTLESPPSAARLRSRSRQYSQDEVVRDYIEYFERHLGRTGGTERSPGAQEEWSAPLRK